MVDDAVEKIEDHVERAVDRIVSQYRDSDRVRALVKIAGEAAQQGEGTLYPLLADRWIGTGEGEQLDRIGEIIGLDRIGRDDEQYRAALRSKVILNRTSGEPEALIEYLRLVLDTEQIIYREAYPATVVIYTDAELTDDFISEALDYVPVGVRLIVTTSRDLLPFGFAESSSEVSDFEFELDNGDLLELSDGSVLGGQTVEGLDLVAYDDFGTFADLGFYNLELSDGSTLETDEEDAFGVTNQEDPIIIEHDDTGVLVEAYEV